MSLKMIYWLKRFSFRSFNGLGKILCVWKCFVSIFLSFICVSNVSSFENFFSQHRIICWHWGITVNAAGSKFWQDQMISFVFFFFTIFFFFDLYLIRFNAEIRFLLRIWTTCLLIDVTVRIEHRSRVGKCIKKPSIKKMSTVKKAFYNQSINNNNNDVVLSHQTQFKYNFHFVNLFISFEGVIN